MPTLPEIGSGLPDVALRTAIVYLFLVVAIRLSGKREVGQMTVLELIVVLVISDAVQNSMVGTNTSIWSGIVAVIVLLGLDLVLRAFSMRSKRFRSALEGEPRLLVRDGRVLDRAVREEGLEVEAIQAAVRSHGLARIDEVRQAVLETDGSISVIPMTDADQSGPSNRPPDEDRRAD